MSEISLLTKPWFRRLYTFAAIIMFLAASLGIGINALNGVPMYADFNTLIASPMSYNEGGDLYRPFIYMPIMGHLEFTQPVGRADHTQLTNNLNVPAVNFLLLPFSHFHNHRLTYYALCGTQLLLSIFVLWRIARRTLPPTAMPLATATLMICAYFPVAANMLLGQIGLFAFIALGAFWLSFDSGKLRQAGIWLGLALILKLFVGLIFVWLLLRKSWTMLLWAALTWSSVMLAGLLVFGLQNHLDWLTVLQNMNWGTQSWNGALHGTIGRYLGGTILLSPLDWPWARFAIESGALIAATTALIWLSRAAQTLGDDRSLRLGLAFCIPVMLLLTPLGWIYYFPMLFVSMAIFWRESAALNKSGKLRGAALLALALSGTPQLITAYDNQKPELWRSIKYDAYFDYDASGNMIMRYSGEHHWFVLPDVYPFALFLLALIIFRLSWRLARE